MTGTPRPCAAFLEPRHLELAEARSRRSCSGRFLPSGAAGTTTPRRAPRRAALVAAMGGRGARSPRRRARGGGGPRSARALPDPRGARREPRRSPTRSSRCRRSASMPITLAGDAELRAALAAGGRRRPRDRRLRDDRARGRLGRRRRSRRRRAATAPDYVLDGEKSFISNAGIADFYCVFASTDRARGNARHLLLRGSGRRPRAALRRAATSSRSRIRSASSPSRVAAFRRRRGSAPRARASSSACARSTACGRRSPPRPAAWPARRSTRRSRTPASRRQFGSPLADLQLVQAKLARMATELDAARLLVYRAAWAARPRRRARHARSGDGEALRHRGGAAHRRRRRADPRRPRRPRRLHRSIGSTARCARCGSTRGPRRSSTW